MAFGTKFEEVFPVPLLYSKDSIAKATDFVKVNCICVNYHKHFCLFHLILKKMQSFQSFMALNIGDGLVVLLSQ